MRRAHRERRLRRVIFIGFHTHISSVKIWNSYKTTGTETRLKLLGVGMSFMWTGRIIFLWHKWHFRVDWIIGERTLWLYVLRPKTRADRTLSKISWCSRSHTILRFENFRTTRVLWFSSLVEVYRNQWIVVRITLHHPDLYHHQRWEVQSTPCSLRVSRDRGAILYKSHSRKTNQRLIRSGDPQWRILHLSFILTVR